jgi:hypothetical protein
MTTYILAELADQRMAELRRSGASGQPTRRRAGSARSGHSVRVATGRGLVRLGERLAA